eukprot:g44148.t1
MVLRLEGLNYKERLDKLGLFSLKRWRLRDDLIEACKIIRSVDKVYSKSLFPRVGEIKTRGHILSVYKFADNATVVGQISNNDESEYRKEIEGLVMWCSDNNLSLNASKIEELIIEFRILSWNSHIDATVKEAQRLFFLGQLRKFCMSIRTLTNFYNAPQKASCLG